MSNQTIVYCMECYHEYPEQNPMVKECPKCGNDDMMRTFYMEEGYEIE